MRHVFPSLSSAALILLLSGCNAVEAPPTAVPPSVPPVAAEPAPAAAPASGTADASLEDALRAASPDYRAAVVGEQPPARYIPVRRDLDGDGVEEVIVYLMGPFFCGTGGCSLLVFARGENSYRKIADAGTARPPVRIVQAGMNGHADIWYRQSGGGGPTEAVQLAYRDGGYGELSRAPENEVPQSDVVIAESVDYQQGIELQPGT